MESRDDCAAVWDRMKRMRHIQMWKLCKGMTKAETELLHVMCRLSKKNPDIPVSQLPQMCCMQTSAISVTEAGAEQCRRNWEEVQDFWERVLARTPEEHIDQMLCLWDEIMDNMETVIDELSQDK